MPATLNLVGDNKCMVAIGHHSVTGTMDNTGLMYIVFNIEGDIGHDAVIMTSQELRTGDVALRTIMAAFEYDPTHDRTNVIFTGTTDTGNTGDVKINYVVV